MKKSLLFCILPLCFFLTACGTAKIPEKTASGETWNSNWTTVGNFLGVEVPENFKEIRNEGVVTSAQTSYIVWAKGNEQTYKNLEENEVKTYDAQIHLLIMEGQSDAEAMKYTAEWDKIAAERYSYSKEWTEDFNEHSFSLTEYEFPEDGGPHTLGASATGINGTFAIHVDVTALDGEDPAEILTGFLAGLHYAETK